MPSTRDQRPYNVAYYAAHREEELQRVKTRQRATLEFLRALRRVPCNDCKQVFPPHMMDFDHRDPTKKLFQIMSGRAQLMSRAKLVAEIEKCDIVCANCHALRTYANLLERRSRSTSDEWLTGKSPYIERKRAHWRASAALMDALCDVPCADCGRRYPPCVMQFDHRDPTTKKYTISKIRSRGLTTIRAEAAKCDIVCANCHRDRTYRRRIIGRDAEHAGVA